MANQPKNYKKFVATAATATLVASAIVPVASAASFSDIEGNTHADAIKALSDAGIIKGYEDGTFKPNAEINRGQTVKLLGRWLETKGYKVPENWNTVQRFNDLPVNAADQELVKYAALVKDAGVFNGSNGNLNYNQPMQRQQMALVLVRAIKTVEGLDLVQEYKAAGYTSKIKDLDKAYSTENVEAITALEYAGITVVENFNPTSAITRGQFASFLNRTINYEAPEAKVVAVTPLNAKQFEIKFNKAIDKSTVISNATTGTLQAGVVTVKRTVNDTTDTNKNIDSATDTITGSLSNDGKTLTITVDATSAKYFDGTYAVTVSDAVKATDGKALSAYAGTFTVKDQTSPTVTNVSYNTISNEIEVTFSEPLATEPDVVRLNGEPVTGVSFVANSNQTKVKFSKPASVAAGSTATVYVAGAKDRANNILTPYTGSVTITNDASDLQVTSVTQISSNKVKVVFNKSLASNNTTIDNALTAIVDGQTVNAADVTAALDTDDDSKKTVIVTFSGTYSAPNYFYGTAASKTVTLVFAANQIEDVFGKKLAAATQNVTMTKDVTGPKVVSAKVASNGKDIEVTFDEEISNTGIDTSKIILRKDGVALNTPNNATRKGSTGDDAKVLVIEPAATDLVSGKLPAGNYSVRLDAGALKDTHTNNNDAVTTTVSVSGQANDLTATIANRTTGTPATVVPNEFEVTFSEDVTAASALNLANYTLDGAALPSNTDIYFKNGAANRTVVIVLPEKSVNIGSATTPANAVLAVKNVQTSAGKTVVSTSATVKVKDNTPATLQAATLIGNNILKLTFDENLASGITFANVADILDDIEISNGSTTFAAGDATHTVSVSGKDLIITITPGTSNWSTVTSSTTVTVKTLAGDGDIKDANGVTVKSDVSVTLTK